MTFTTINCDFFVMLQNGYTVQVLTIYSTLNSFVEMTITCLQKQRIHRTERVVGVFVRLVRGWSTVNLIVSQFWNWNTHRVTESYVKIHQTAAALQVSTLHNVNATSK